MIRVTVIALLFSTVVACAPRAANNGAVAPREGATLMVDNQSSDQMTIYAVRGAERVRLGQVVGLARRAFAIPSTLVNGVSLRFQADPLARTRAPISQEIVVWAGDTVTMIIPPF
jgi:hypothetical protein